MTIKHNRVDIKLDISKSKQLIAIQFSQHIYSSSFHVGLLMSYVMFALNHNALDIIESLHHAHIEYVQTYIKIEQTL